MGSHHSKLFAGDSFAHVTISNDTWQFSQSEAKTLGQGMTIGDDHFDLPIWACTDYIHTYHRVLALSK